MRLSVTGVLKRRQEALARPGVPCLFAGNLIKLPVIRALVNAPFAVLAHNGVPLALQGIELPLDLGKLGAVSLLLRTRGLLLCREQLERFGRMVYPVVHIGPYLRLYAQRIHPRRKALAWRLTCGHMSLVVPLRAHALGGADIVAVPLAGKRSRCAACRPAAHIGGAARGAAHEAIEEMFAVLVCVAIGAMPAQRRACLLDLLAAEDRGYRMAMQCAVFGAKRPRARVGGTRQCTPQHSRRPVVLLLRRALYSGAP